jgi:hypothetical protein
MSSVAEYGPLATTIAAMVAFAVGWRTIGQRDRMDRREQWWKRVQWALDRTLSDSSPLDRRVGLAVLRALLTNQLADGQDTAIADAVWHRLLDRRERLADNETVYVERTGNGQEVTNDEDRY